MFVLKSWFDILILSAPHSLKEKRMVIRSLKDRIKNKFSVSVAEVGKNDLWQRAELGIAFVTNDMEIARNTHRSITGLIDSEISVEILDQFQEIEKLK